MKTHAEGIAESMGSVMDSYCLKSSPAIEEMGKESIIHWSGHPVHLAILVKSP